MNLFGPVLFYDLVRMARRSRYILLRCLYALLLLGLMWLVYQSHFHSYRGTAAPSELSGFAEKFFMTFMTTQFLLLLLLTPAYTGGAIAEEKERRTLEYILTTDLRNREIILSKLLSRLANLALFLIAGLPVLSLVQLFGGVEPMLLWCGFGATGVALVSVASLSLLNSVYAKKPRDAILLTYLIIIGYHAISGLLAWLHWMLFDAPPPPFGTKVPADWMESQFGRFELVYNSGNVVMLLVELAWGSVRTGSFANLPVELLGRYALFHGVFSALCIGLAILRLRKVFIRQTYATPLKLGRFERYRKRPAIGEFPMIWKEVYSERSFKSGLVGKIIMTILVLAALAPGVGVMVHYSFFATRGTGGFYPWTLEEEFARSMNAYVRTVGTGLGCLMILAVAIRAAGSIGSERDRQTFDSLLTTPMSNSEILFGKWLGSITGLRRLFLVLLVIWIMGLATGGLSLLALPVLLLVLLIYAAFYASLGLAIAARAKTTLRSVVWTVFATIFAGGGHIFCFMLVYVPLRAGRGGGDDWPMKLELGLINPFVMAAAQFCKQDFSHPFGPQREFIVETAVSCALGLLIFAGLAAVLWGLALDGFKQRCGRVFERPQPNALTSAKR